jgi:hypothetical protein
MGILSQALGIPPIAAPTQGDVPPWLAEAEKIAAQSHSPYEKKSQTPSILGFLPGLAKNVVGDVGEFATGLASLIGLGAGDVYSGLADVVEEINPLDQNDQDRSYFLDDMAKAMIYDPALAKQHGSVFAGIAPAIQDDIRERYGSPSKFAKGVYNDPLFFLADIAGLGSLAGKGLELGAKSALKTGGVADELAQLGVLEKQRLLAQLSDNASLEDIALLSKQIEHFPLSGKAAGVKRTLPGAGWGELKTGLDDFDAIRLAEHMGATPEYKFGLGGLRADVPWGGKTDPILSELKTNPFQRWARGKIRNLPGLSVSVDKLEEGLGAMAYESAEQLVGHKVEGSPRTIVDSIHRPAAQPYKDLPAALQTHARVVETARRMGMERVATHTVDKLRAQKAFDKMAGMITTRFYTERDTNVTQLVTRIQDEVNNHVATAAAGMSKADTQKLANAFLDRVHIKAQVDTPASQGRVRFDLAMADYLARQVDLPEEMARRIEMAGVHVDRPSRTVRLGAANEAPAVGAMIARTVPGSRFVDNVIEGDFHHAYVELPDGTRVRLLSPEGQNAANAMDSVLRRHGSIEGELAAAIAAGNAEDIARLTKEVKLNRMEAEDLSELWAVDALRAYKRPVDPEAALIAGLRVDMHNQTVGPYLDRGKFKSVADLKARAYLPIKLELFAAKDGALQKALLKARDGDLTELGKLGYSDPKAALRDLMISGPGNKRMLLDKTRLDEIGGMDMTEYLDDMYRANGRQAPLYFPHLAEEFNTATDFLFRRSAVGMKQMAESGRTKHALGWLYADDTYSKNPLDVYARAAAQTRKFIDMEDMADEIRRRFARPISSISDLGPYEKVFAPSLFKRFIKLRAEVEMTVLKHIMEGADETEAWKRGWAEAMDTARVQDWDLDSLTAELAEKFGGLEAAQTKLAEYELALKNNNAAMVADIEEGIFSATGKPAQLYAIPEVVAKRLDQMGKYHMGWKARAFWDGPMDVWRASVLAFSPRWIFYNLLGNITFLKMQGGKLSDAFRILGGQLVAGLFGEAYEPAFLKRVRSMLAELEQRNPDLARNLHGGFFSGPEQKIRALGFAEETGVGAQMSRHKLGATSQAFSKGAARMRRLNEVIEDSFRTAGYMTAIERAAAEAGIKTVGASFIRSLTSLDDIAKFGADESLAARGLEEVNYFFNDYTRMGPIERNVIRRFIAPFYSFYKHILRLTATYPFEHPLRATVIRQMGEMTREMAAEFGAMPDWLVGSVPIGEGQNPDETRFLNTRGANPFNALGNMWESMGSSLAPQWKMLMEQITGRSMLTGKPFSSPDAITPFGSQQQYEVDPNTGEVVPITVRPDPLYHLASQFPQFKLGLDAFSALSGEGVGARYGTGEMMLNPDGTPLFPSNFALDLASFGGLSTTDFALEKFQERQAMEQKSVLREWLERQGYLEEEPA